MLPKSAIQKGKNLENYVADALLKIDKYAYRRQGSGNGKLRKEDVSTSLPLHIECKNQNILSIPSWWVQTERGCPANKFPVLIYKVNYQRDPNVVMYFDDLMAYLGDQTRDQFGRPFKTSMTIKFEDFMRILNQKVVNSNIL